MLSAIVFVIIKLLTENIEFGSKSKTIKTIQIIGSTTFGVYLVHVIVINLFKHGDLGFTLDAFSMSPLYSIPVLTIFTFLLSFVIIFIIQRIPIIKISSP